MKIDIQHVEKSQGLIFSKTLHGVSLSVAFSEEEKQIIQQRGLERQRLLERDAPADVNAEKHANRSLVRKIATAAISGIDANNFDLTIGKLLRGPDVYFFRTPIEAKAYESELRECLPMIKAFIMENADIAEKSSSFEL